MARSTLTKSPTNTRSALRGIAMSFGALALAGCISPVAGPSGTYATPIGNAPVISNETPYSTALRCMSRQVRGRGMAGPRIAVGQIADYTGKEEFEGGRKVTQGAALMAISALAKAGVRLVERFDTGVSELELKYANNKLIGDNGAEGAYRQVHAGQIPGSDYYLVGGITELNANIRSNGQDAFAGDSVDSDPSALFSRRIYVMNVGLDLRLIDSRTLEVVDVVSYQKQIIGRELSAGVFAFLLGGGKITLSRTDRNRPAAPKELRGLLRLEIPLALTWTARLSCDSPSSVASVLVSAFLSTDTAFDLLLGSSLSVLVSSAYAIVHKNETKQVSKVFRTIATPDRRKL